MDIYVIGLSDFKDRTLIEKFAKKQFSDKNKLFTHCCTYYALDKILENNYQITNREIVFEHGKPFLKNSQKCISLSHSNNYAVVAVSDFDCGIDIEKIKKRDYKAISKRMNMVCKSLEEFYSAWTKYEAEYKMAKDTKSSKKYKIEDYILTAVSSNEKEDFQIVFQNLTDFSN